MSLSVFLVEDETPTRKGIRENVPWDVLDMSYIGEARNGREAYPMILDLKPDIVISDIKMPLMDGLELAEKIKDALPGTKIVLISAYNEFTFAQKAIDIGVLQYVLKPITPKKIFSSLQKVKNTIQNEELEDRQRRMQPLDRPVSLPKLAELIEDVDRRRYVCVVLVGENRENEFLDLAVFLGDDGHIYFFQSEPTGCLVVDDSEEECRERVYRFINGIDGQQMPDETTFALSRVEPASIGAESLYAQATRTRNHHHLFGTARISSYSDLEALLAANRNLVERDTDSLVRFLLEGKPEECRSFLEKTIRSPKNIGLGMRYFLVYTAVDILAVITAFVTENVGDPAELIPDIADPDRLLDSCVTVDRTVSILRPILEAALSLRDRVRSPHYELIIKARAAIEENFTDPSYSLLQCAESCGMSPAHFSTVFKQTMSESFIKYLTKTRMDRAKVLLKTTALQASEIAGRVGYRDAHYFSFVFRKNIGRTPTAYRSDSLEIPETVGG